jgi:hypothetical protein
MTFSPPRVAISAITQANPCVVTTEEDHLLHTGAVVRLHVPKNYGMDPLNNNAYIITVLSSTMFSLQAKQVPPSINIDSTEFPAFTIPSNPQFTAEVISIGSGPTPLTNTVPQTLNNVCVTILENAEQNITIINPPF